MYMGTYSTCTTIKSSITVHVHIICTCTGAIIVHVLQLSSITVHVHIICTCTWARIVHVLQLRVV